MHAHGALILCHARRQRAIRRAKARATHQSPARRAARPAARRRLKPGRKGVDGHRIRPRQALERPAKRAGGGADLPLRLCKVRLRLGHSGGPAARPCLLQAPPPRPAAPRQAGPPAARPAKWKPPRAAAAPPRHRLKAPPRPLRSPPPPGHCRRSPGQAPQGPTASPGDSRAGPARAEGRCRLKPAAGACRSGHKGLRRAAGRKGSVRHGSHISSPPRPASTMVPSSASRRAVETISFWASTTSLSRTGPIASISSRMPAAARPDRQDRSRLRSPSSAPFSASASRSGAMPRISVCRLRSSDRPRLSKTNMLSWIAVIRSRSSLRMSRMIRASVPPRAWFMIPRRRLHAADLRPGGAGRRLELAVQHGLKLAQRLGRHHPSRATRRITSVCSASGSRATTSAACARAGRPAPAP